MIQAAAVPRPIIHLTVAVLAQLAALMVKTQVKLQFPALFLLLLVLQAVQPLKLARDSVPQNSEVVLVATEELTPLECSPAILHPKAVD